MVALLVVGVGTAPLAALCVLFLRPACQAAILVTTLAGCRAETWLTCPAGQTHLILPVLLIMRNTAINTSACIALLSPCDAFLGWEFLAQKLLYLRLLMAWSCPSEMSPERAVSSSCDVMLRCHSTPVEDQCVGGGGGSRARAEYWEGSSPGLRPTCSVDPDKPV